jgi:ketosteroid isomerase-like protein
MTAAALAADRNNPSATDACLSSNDRAVAALIAFDGADHPAQLPEPKGISAASDASAPFRRDVPDAEPRRRAGRASATDRTAPALPARAESATSSEVAAIEAAATAYREAIAKGDVEAVSKFWTSDADYIDQAGHVFPIKEKLKQARAKQREGQPVGRRTMIDPGHTIRIIMPGVALEDGTFQRSTDADGEPIIGRYTAVWLKRDGRWLLDGVRESAVVDATPADHLHGLAWLVGDWQGEGNGITADASCLWGPDKNYMLRKIVMHGAAGDVDSTIQWIGWDPVQKEIRSFVFDSRGGFEDGVWQKDGDAWVVSVRGVLPDGRQTSFTNILSRVDTNHVICEIVEDQVDGEPVADIRLDFKRKAKTAQ